MQPARKPAAEAVVWSSAAKPLAASKPFCPCDCASRKQCCGEKLYWCMQLWRGAAPHPGSSSSSSPVGWQGHLAHKNTSSMYKSNVMHAQHRCSLPPEEKKTKQASATRQKTKPAQRNATGLRTPNAGRHKRSHATQADTNQERLMDSCARKPIPAPPQTPTSLLLARMAPCERAGTLPSVVGTRRVANAGSGSPSQGSSFQGRGPPGSSRQQR